MSTGHCTDLHAAHDDFEGLDGGHDQRGGNPCDDAALGWAGGHALVQAAVEGQPRLVRGKAQAVGHSAAHLRQTRQRQLIRMT